MLPIGGGSLVTVSGVGFDTVRPLAQLGVTGAGVLPFLIHRPFQRVARDQAGAASYLAGGSSTPAPGLLIGASGSLCRPRRAPSPVVPKPPVGLAGPARVWVTFNDYDFVTEG